MSAKECLQVAPLVMSSKAPAQTNVRSHQAHSCEGVLYILWDYGGDIMNFDMATEMAQMEDIEALAYLFWLKTT